MAPINKLLSITLAALLPLSTLAAPADTRAIKARSNPAYVNNEVNYLVNCYKDEHDYYSEVDFYWKGISSTQAGAPPDSTAYAQYGTDPSDVPAALFWEQNEVTAYFADSKETFRVNIYGDAASYTPGTESGWGENNESHYTCYKEDEWNLYTKADGRVCQVVYGCPKVTGNLIIG